MAKIEWDTVASFIEGIGATDKTITFPKVQDTVKVTNKGNVNVIYTIGTQTGTISPSDSKEVKENISSFTVRASSGTSEIYVRASEAGTEKEEIPSDIPADIAVQLEDVKSSLAQMATQRTRGNVVSALGDSITANNGSSPTQRLPKGYLNWVGLLSHQKLRWMLQQGGSGYTTAQILAEKLPALLAYSELPNYCIVIAGTNDVGQSIPLSTTIENLTKIYDGLLEKGIIPVACTIPPRPVSSNMQVATNKVNAWVRKNAQQKGYPFVDLYKVLADPATGEFKTGYDEGDGIHPSPTGAKAMGQELVRVLQPIVSPWEVPLVTANNSPTNLVSNGVFLNDSNADGLPDGWSLQTGSAVFSIVDPVNDDALGKWFKINKAATGGYTVRSSSINVTAGNKMYFAIKLKTTGLEAGASTINVNVIKTGAGNTRLSNAVYSWAKDIEIGTFYGEFTIPTDGSVTSIQIDVVLSGSGDVYLAQPTIVDMTALGIA